MALAALAVARSAHAGSYAYECVDQYNACFAGADLSNRCTNAQGMANILHNNGHSQTSSWSNTGVYNSDMMESDAFFWGHDTSYSDVPSADLWMFSGHGQCDGASNTCASDADCAINGPGWRCDYESSPAVCKQNIERKLFTCSSSDTGQNGRYHNVSVTNEMRFGESPTTGGWAGVGQNGGINVAVLDASCPFHMPFYIEENSQIFAGMHIELGFSGEGGDTGDIGQRGSAFAQRLVNGQAVGGAWIDTTRYDASYGVNGRVCVQTISCENGQWMASWRVGTETWPYGVDPLQSPTWCQWVYWCNF